MPRTSTISPAFSTIERNGGVAWLHTEAPVWVVHYPGIPGSTHRYDSWQAYRAVTKVPKGRWPWTVNNKRIGDEDGFQSAEEAFAAAEAFVRQTAREAA